MIEEKRTVELNLTEGEASLIALSLQHTVSKLKSLNSRQKLRRVFGDIECNHLNELQKILYNNFAYSRQYEKFRKHTVNLIQFALYIGASSGVISTIGVCSATIARMIIELATCGFGIDVQKETITVYFDKTCPK